MPAPDLERWMTANDLEPAVLEALVEDEARAEALRERFGRSLDGRLLDVLRLGGDYRRLSERARRKEEAIAASALAAGSSTPIFEAWSSGSGTSKAASAGRRRTTFRQFAARLGFADALGLRRDGPARMAVCQ